MKRINELEKRLIDCIEITDFLLNHNKEDVAISLEHQDTYHPIFCYKYYYLFKYVYNGKLKKVSVDKFHTGFYKKWQVVENDDEYAILSVENAFSLTPKREYYKLDKGAGCIVDVTGLFPKESQAEKTMELTNIITMEILKAENKALKEELEKFKQPKKIASKSAKNVKKTAEKPAKNVKKKATKKKENKNG